MIVVHTDHHRGIPIFRLTLYESRRVLMITLNYFCLREWKQYSYLAFVLNTFGLTFFGSRQIILYPQRVAFSNRTVRPSVCAPNRSIMEMITSSHTHVFITEKCLFSRGLVYRRTDNGSIAKYHPLRIYNYL